MLWLKVILLIVPLVNVKAVDLLVSNRRETQPIQRVPVRLMPRPTLVRPLSTPQDISYVKVIPAPGEKEAELVQVPNEGIYYQNDVSRQSHQNFLPYLRQGPRTSSSVSVVQQVVPYSDISQQQDKEANIAIKTVSSSKPTQSKVVGILVETSNPSAVDLTPPKESPVPVLIAKNSQADDSEDSLPEQVKEMEANPSRLIFSENPTPSEPEVVNVEIIKEKPKPVQNLGSDTLIVVKQPTTLSLNDFGVYENKPMPPSPPLEANPTVVENNVEEKVVDLVKRPNEGIYYHNDVHRQTHQNLLPYLRQGPRTSPSVSVVQQVVPYSDISEQQDKEANIAIKTVSSSIPTQSKLVGILVETPIHSSVDLTPPKESPLPVLIEKESEQDDSENSLPEPVREIEANPSNTIFPENPTPSEPEVVNIEIIKEEPKPVQNLGSDTVIVVKQPTTLPLNEFGVYENKPVPPSPTPESNPAVVEKVVVKIEPEKKVPVQILPETSIGTPTNKVILEKDVTPLVLKPVEVKTEPEIMVYKPNPNPTSFVTHYVSGPGENFLYRPKPERPKVNEGVVPLDNKVVVVEGNKSPEILPVGVIVEPQVPVSKPKPTSFVAHYLSGSEDNVMYRPKPELPSVVAVVPQPSPTVTIIATEVEPRPKPAKIAPPLKPVIITPPLKPVIIAPPPKPTTIQIPSYIPKTPLVSNPRPFVNPIGVQLMDYKCSDAFGFYAVQNDCDTYIECQQYVAYKFECPDGLRFNRNTVWPEYPCSYSWEVQCETSAVQREAQPTSQCPRKYGYFAIQNGDCSNYVICQEGVATVMNCPAGLVFNPEERICDWPERVPSCRPKAFVGFTCPNINEEEEGYISKFRYGTSCKEYIACQRGQPRLLSCDSGLAFDEQSQVCVDADYIKDCTR